ncbi:MAG: DsbA family protein [Pseudomonadota bacterium]
MSGTMSADSERHLLYFADPMCSWCYGFSPVIAALAEHFRDRLALRVVMGGLRAGNTQPMRDQDRDYIRGAWTNVGEASGQPFDFSFFDRETFIYDTEPACRAVVVTRNTAPAKTLQMKSAISDAFYANNRDVTDVDVLCDIAGELGEDNEQFRQMMLNPEIRNETFRDFLFSQQSGVEGFPCLLVGNEQDGYVLVTHGFRPLAGLPEAIETWLEQQTSPSPTA